MTKSKRNEITRNQLINELCGKSINASSIDCGNINLSCYGATINYNADMDELSIMKPGTLMEVGICLDIVDSITKDGDTYTLEFDNGLADVEIDVAK